MISKTQKPNEVKRLCIPVFIKFSGEEAMLLKDYKNLNELMITDNKQLTDLNFLEHLEDATHLNLARCNLTLDNLDGLLYCKKLEDLVLTDNPCSQNRIALLRKLYGLNSAIKTVNHIAISEEERNTLNDIKPNDFLKDATLTVKNLFCTIKKTTKQKEVEKPKSL